MHPHLSTQYALLHRHDLEAAAGRRRTSSSAPPSATRTRVGLALVRVGLRMSGPLTPAMITTRPEQIGV